jgi:hypothetical protein
MFGFLQRRLQMWWYNIKEIKESLNLLNLRLTNMEENIYGHQSDTNVYLDSIYYLLKEMEMSDSLVTLSDNIKTLIRDTNHIRQVALAEKTLDKFEDYMKNVDKLNSMINEFKGCVSIARASLKDTKKSKE